MNGRIKYALDDGVEAFVIDPTSGILRTATSLDRESIPQYNIHVFAIDKGSPSLSTAVSSCNFKNKYFALILNFTGTCYYKN